MYDLQQRANTVLSFAVTAFACFLGVVSLLSVINGYGQVDGNINVDTNVVKVVNRRYGPEHYDYRSTKSEFARVLFDVDADFTPLFNWNTKQIFVTVVAEYESPSHNRNSVVLWDRIIGRKDDAKLLLKNVPNKYALIDVSQKWSHQKANLSLQWDITPHVGMLKAGRAASTSGNFVLSPVQEKPRR
ncbi:signal peptidase 22kDa subunit [Phycomyces nitens]|nr:signal peptidase 22kDa subunit [Phycomyces nitens]